MTVLQKFENSTAQQSSGREFLLTKCNIRLKLDLSCSSVFRIVEPARQTWTHQKRETACCGDSSDMNSPPKLKLQVRLMLSRIMGWTGSLRFFLTDVWMCLLFRELSPKRRTMMSHPKKQVRMDDVLVHSSYTTCLWWSGAFNLCLCACRLLYCDASCHIAFGQCCGYWSCGLRFPKMEECFEPGEHMNMEKTATVRCSVVNTMCISARPKFIPSGNIYALPCQNHSLLVEYGS